MADVSRGKAYPVILLQLACMFRGAGGEREKERREKHVRSDDGEQAGLVGLAGRNGVEARRATCYQKPTPRYTWHRHRSAQPCVSDLTTTAEYQ